LNVVSSEETEARLKRVLGMINVVPGILDRDLEISATNTI
jgi:hypothetical protein